jgi:hypothetical protein
MFKPLTELFRKPSAEILAQRELEDAKRELLAAQAGLEYCTAMVDYHVSRIQRLSAMVKEGGHELL